MVPPVTELAPASGAETPSGDPFPNSSGCFDQRFASLYEIKDEISHPVPGIAPIAVPIADERK